MYSDKINNDENNNFMTNIPDPTPLLKHFESPSKNSFALRSTGQTLNFKCCADNVKALKALHSWNKNNPANAVTIPVTLETKDTFCEVFHSSTAIVDDSVEHVHLRYDLVKKDWFFEQYYFNLHNGFGLGAHKFVEKENFCIEIKALTLTHLTENQVFQREVNQVFRKLSGHDYQDQAIGFRRYVFAKWSGLTLQYTFYNIKRRDQNEQGFFVNNADASIITMPLDKNVVEGESGFSEKDSSVGAEGLEIELPETEDEEMGLPAGDDYEFHRFRDVEIRRQNTEVDVEINARMQAAKNNPIIKNLEATDTITVRTKALAAAFDLEIWSSFNQRNLNLFIQSEVPPITEFKNDRAIFQQANRDNSFSSSTNDRVLRRTAKELMTQFKLATFREQKYRCLLLVLSQMCSVQTHHLTRLVQEIRNRRTKISQPVVDHADFIFTDLPEMTVDGAAQRFSDQIFVKLLPGFEHCDSEMILDELE